jgi:diketogulonate reductase-like aldo/keto reductase
VVEREIPASGETLPVIGLGTWQTFDVGNDAAARQRLAKVLQVFFTGGGRLIDSSPMYGTSERVVGDLLAALRLHERAFLTTKVWTTGRQAGIDQMRRSAALMRTSRIDLMQVHNLVDWRTHLDTMRRMKDSGAIRYIGITHYTVASLPDLAAIIEREPIDFVQLIYSVEHRAAEERVLPLAVDRNVAVIANLPFGGGKLLQRLKNSQLPPWAVDIGCSSWAQLMLKYIVSHPAVTCTIPATSSPEHMADNLAAGNPPMPDGAMRRRMVELWNSL